MAAFPPLIFKTGRINERAAGDSVLLTSAEITGALGFTPGVGTITGSGSTGRIAQFTAAGAIGDSNLIGPASNLLTLAASSNGITLTVPATGTAALREVDNAFTVAQGVRAAFDAGVAAGLYVPWITGDTKSTLYVGSSSSSNARVALEAQSGSGVAVSALCNAASGLPLNAQLTDTGTSNTATVAVFNRRTSGTPAAGFGLSFVFRGESSTTNDNNMALLAATWADATHASRKARVTFSANDSAAAREFLRGEADGTAALIGFLGANAALRQTSGADLTNNVTSGGTNDTIANYTDLVIYANDAAAIRNDLYQLARKVKQVNDALRLYGLLT